jgi:ceramide glucosyltransferase
MHAVSTVLRWLVLVVALTPGAFYLLAILGAWRFFREEEAPPTDFAPPISVLKPVRGLDREAYENFASFCHQDYPQYEVLFGVRNPDDPCITVIQQIIRDFPSVPVRLVVGAEQLGANNKVNKLCRLAAEAHYDLLVINDSDIRVEPDYLRRVAAPFQDPAVGAVTAMYVAQTDGALGSDLEGVGITSDFHPGVLVAWLLEGVKFALGATMACPRARLEEIGGFEALVNHFSDDFEFGNRIAANGYQIELLKRPVTIVYPRQSTVGFFKHQLRWALSTRYSRPWGHFGLVLTFGLPWSLAAAAVATSASVAWAYLAGYLVLRYLVVWAVGILGLKDQLLRRRWWLVPLRDALACFVWVASYFARRINWRGTEFYVVKGQLVPVVMPVAAADASPSSH